MSPATPVLVLVDPARLQAAVQALRHGAEDYLLRPPDPSELRTRLGRILERHDLDSRIALLQGELSKNQGLKNVVSWSPAMQAVLDRVLRIAPLKATVLIHGESGVGKELVARSIHFNSPRRDYPFIALNCAAMPQSLIESELFGHEKGSFTGAHARARGKFEIAHRGTLFLDEIGEMDHATQAKLLRVLEEKEFMRVGGDQSIRVDVRVIAATNADLENMVERSLFRRDLYYRLKVLIVHVPPLRERRQDIPALVETFLDELSRANAVRRKAIVPEALDALTSYHWPGNVRELKNILESVLVSSSGDVIRLEDLPPSVRRENVALERPEMAVGMTLEDMEREMIRRTLEHTGGNRTHCAALLGIGVRTLQRKIREFRLEIPSKRRRPRRRAAEADALKVLLEP
jgi:DNA-binding NtrC family response regulator